jgi:O-antigen/teichoic acid export membrane protein
MFWRGVFGYLPLQVFKGLIGFGSVFAFTRLLTPEEYGQYALAFPAAALVQAIFLTWTEAAVERFHVAEARGDGLANHFVTLHRAFAACAALAALLTLVTLAALDLHPALELAIALGVASGVVRSGLRLVQKRRRAEGQVFAYALTDVVSSGAGFAVGAVAAAYGWGAAAPLFGGLVAAAGCLLLEGAGELRGGRGGRFEPHRARRYAAYGVPVALSLILGLVLSSADRFLIAALLDPASVGVYHAGYGVAHRALDMMFIWLGLAGGPAVIAALDRGGAGDFRKAARTQADVMLLLGIPAAAGIALVADPLAELMVGPALREGAARVIPWIAASGFFAGFTTYYLNQSFVLAKRSGVLMLSVSVPAALLVALNLLLVPRFGLDGAMWAATLSFAGGAASAYGFGRRILPMPLPAATIARCGAAAVAMSAVVLALPSYGAGPDLLLGASAGALAYAAALAALEVVFPSRARAGFDRWLASRRARRAGGGAVATAAACLP